MQTRLVSDLAVASYLLSLGYQQVKPLEFKGKTLLLYFKTSEQLEEEIKSFYAGTAKVDPQTFTDHLTYLRAHLRQLRESRKAQRPMAEVSHG